MKRKQSGGEGGFHWCCVSVGWEGGPYANTAIMLDVIDYGFPSEDELLWAKDLSCFNRLQSLTIPEFRSRSTIASNP